MGPDESAAWPLGWLFISTKCKNSSMTVNLAEFEVFNALPCLLYGYLTSTLANGSVALHHTLKDESTPLGMMTYSASHFSSTSDLLICTTGFLYSSHLTLRSLVSLSFETLKPSRMQVLQYKIVPHAVEHVH